MGRTPSSHPAQTLKTPLERLFQLAPDRYSYCLIQCLAQEKSVRFTKLQARFGLSTKTLTKRLKQLAALGVVERIKFQESPPRVEYRLTASGKRLSVLLDRLADWSSLYCPR